MSLANPCLPCVFGALSTELLSYPSVRVQSPHAVTRTIGGRLDISFTADEPSDYVVWTTSGAVLTYPTTYVRYVAFAGTTADAGSCANTLPAKSLTTPSYVDPGMFLYLLNGYTTVPSALMFYLNAQPAFMTQLGTYSLTQCGQFATVAPSLTSMMDMTPASSWSAAAIGGISVAAVLVVFATFMAAAFILRRRRLASIDNPGDKPELGGSSVASGAELESDEVIEAGSGPLAEADAEAQLAAEMHTHHAAHELHD